MPLTQRFPSHRLPASRPALRLILATIGALAALFVGLVPSAGATACEGADKMPAALGAEGTAEVTACLLNEERTSRGLRPLRTNSILERAAGSYAGLLVREQHFDHVSPSGTTPLRRIKAAGYLRRARGYKVGENLAWGSGTYATPEQIVEAWMRSSGHRRNILDRDYREFGLGVTLDAPVDLGGETDAGTYVTAFGYRER